MTNFVNLDELYEQFNINLVSAYQHFLPMLNIEKLSLKKFTEIYECFEDLYIFDMYILIDGIDDMKLLLNYKKYILKIFALAASFKHLKLVLVSNFDMTKSELRNFFDFSSFISECFPLRNLEDYKNILSNRFNSVSYDSSSYNDILTRSIINFQHSFTNLNEYIYCIGENLNLFAQSSYKDYLEEIRQSMEKINLNLEEPSSNVIFPNTSIIDKKSPKKNSCISKLNSNLIQQITVSPIHMQQLMNTQNDPSTSSNTDLSKLNLMQSNKNLTESLSKSQKILLLSAFFASETSPAHDSVIFKNVKKTKIKKAKSMNRSLKSKALYNFNIHRLLGIYSSMKMIIDDCEKISNRDVNIELISDIGTLSSLNLIRYVKFNENNFLSRKYTANIGIDFAKKIADDFGISLSDFINLDRF